MKKIFLLLLFVSMTFLAKAQIQPLSRKPVMRPIEPPHLQEKFTQTWGKTVKVVKKVILMELFMEVLTLKEQFSDQH